MSQAGILTFEMTSQASIGFSITLNHTYTAEVPCTSSAPPLKLPHSCKIETFSICS